MRQEFTFKTQSFKLGKEEFTRKLKKSWPGKLSKTTTMSFLPNNNCLNNDNALGTNNNDSFIKRIQNQSLLRDISISSLHQKEEKKKSACEQISRFLKEG